MNPISPYFKCKKGYWELALSEGLQPAATSQLAYKWRGVMKSRIKLLDNFFPENWGGDREEAENCTICSNRRSTPIPCRPEQTEER